MDLISYSEFAKLKLRQFCRSDISESDSPDWEWMGGLWYCDAVGFTWFGRLREQPEETGALEIDCSALPERESINILDSLHLPLRAGMSCDAIKATLGAPFETHTFVRDRKTYEFKTGSHYPYWISCTVRDGVGLTFISIIREDILAKLEAV